MTLHSDAATGTLLPGALYNYLKACKIDDQSNERGNQTIGLTPLALAARNGQKDTVQLLLDNSAKVDALSTQYRTPLWIVTNRGRGEDRPEIVELLLKRGADVKYSHSTLYDSTPLMNELNQGRDPDVIQLLVEMGGKTPAAEEIAKKLDDPIINDAMQSTQQRSNLRATIVDLITALILFIIAWANNPAITGIANKVFKKFQISGKKDSPMAKKIAAVSR
jgi:ankyrin repeat protein